MENGKYKIALWRTFCVSLIISLVFPFGLADQVRAAVPRVINYQSRLRDASLNPITVPTNIQYTLYNHATNGAFGDAESPSGPLLWKEVHDGVGCPAITPDADGYFAVQLGACVAFPAYIDFNQPLYLGVRIGADAEAAPRVLFAAHPYSLNAETVDTLHATTTAAPNQILALDNDLNFNISTGTFSGGGLLVNGSSTLQNLTFTVATGTSLELDSFLAIGAIRLDAVGTSNVSSGAYLVGVFDEFDNSNATTVQGALRDLDIGLTAVSSSLSAFDLQAVTDNGNTTTNAIQFAGGTSTGSINPSATDSLSLGSSSTRWSDVWTGTLHVGTSTWDVGQDAAQQAFTVSRQGGSEVLRLTYGRHMGLNTINPLGQFDIQSIDDSPIFQVHTTSGNLALNVAVDATGKPDVGFGDLGGLGNTTYLAVTDQDRDIRLQSGGIVRMGDVLNLYNGNSFVLDDPNYIASFNGYDVGINTAAPSSTFHLNAPYAQGLPLATYQNNAGDFQLFHVVTSPEGSVTGSPGDLAVNSASGTMFIKVVGIGTNTGWQQYLTGASGTVTLDLAYDGGGSGAGRFITADAGPITITGLTYTQGALNITNTTDSQAVFVNNTGVGNAFSARNMSSGAGFYARNQGSGPGVRVDNNAAGGLGVWVENQDAGTAIQVDNYSSGLGLLVNNSGSGFGNQILNSGSGMGLNIHNSSSTGLGLYVRQNDGFGIRLDNNTVNDGLRINNYGSGKGLYVDNTSGDNGMYMHDSGGKTGFQIDKLLNGGNAVELNVADGARSFYVMQAGTGEGFWMRNSGTGASLWIEDAASDLSPFVLDADGRLGVSATNTSNFVLTVGGHAGPSAHNAYDLGSATSAWRNLYTQGFVSTTAVYVNGQLIPTSTGSLQAAYDAGRTINTADGSTPVEIINPGTAQWETAFALTNGANGGGIALQTMDAFGDFGGRIYLTDDTSDPENGTGAFMHMDNTMQAFEFGYQTAGTRNSDFYIDYNQMALNVPGTQSNGAFRVLASNWNVPVLTLAVVGPGNSVQFSVGTSTPEGKVTADSGSIFHRVDGTGGDQMYVKTTDGGTTGWVSVLTASSTLAEADTLQTVTNRGNATTNTIQFAGGTSTGGFNPSTTNSLSLGSSSTRWSDVWTANLHLGTSTWDLAQNAAGDFTVSDVGGSMRLAVDRQGHVSVGQIDGRGTSDTFNILGGFGLQRDAILRLDSADGNGDGWNAGVLINSDENNGGDPGYIDFQTNGTHHSYIYGSNGADGLSLQTDAVLPITFYTAGDERMRLTADGRIGLLTNDPNAFDVQVAGHFGPDSDDQFDLGSATMTWRNVYAGLVTTTELYVNGQQVYGGSTTLDTAYDAGGAGLGRFITADAGPIHISGLVSPNGAIHVESATDSQAIYVNNTGVGNGFSARNMDTGAGFYARNQGVGNGFYVDNNTNSGRGIYVLNNMMGRGFVVENSHQGDGMFLDQSGTRVGFRLNNTGTGVGQLIRNDQSIGLQIDNYADSFYGLEIRNMSDGYGAYIETSGGSGLYITDTGSKAGIKVNTTAGTANMLELENAADARPIYIIHAGTQEGFWMRNTGTGPSLYIEDQNSESTPFVLDADGNLGVGTTSTWNFALTAGGDVGPDLDDAYDLGSEEYSWHSIYADGFVSTTALYVNGQLVPTSTANVYNSDGNLTGDRLIHGNGYGLNVSTTNGGYFDADIRDGADYSFSHVSSDQIELSSTNGVSSGYMVFGSGGVTLNHNAGGSSTMVFVGPNLTVTDNYNLRGMEYAADYSANYTPRTLVDKAYVDGHLSAVPGSGLAWNGVTEKIDFGGNLTKNTNLDYGNWDYKILHGSSYQLYNASNYVSYFSEGVSSTGWLQDEDGFTISGTPGFAGIVYGADYSARFTPRSLVDKAYVDSLLAAATGTPDLQQVTDYGNTTTKAIQFAGGTSTADFYVSAGLTVGDARRGTDVLNVVASGGDIAGITLDSVDGLGSGGSSYLTLNGDMANGGDVGIQLWGNGVTVGNIAATNGLLEMYTMNGAGIRLGSLGSAVYIDGATDFVGIGTSVPTSTLHVNSMSASTTEILTLENIADGVQAFVVQNDPEGRVSGSVGDFAFDSTRGLMYLKQSGIGTDTGWAAVATGTLPTQHWQKNSNILAPTDSAVYQLAVTNNSANTLTGFKAVNTNDVNNYAGAVIELKGSGADYTNNLYFGKYGAGFYIPSWAGNGVMATDKNLIIGALGNSSQMVFQVTGGYTTPLSVMTLTGSGLAFATGTRVNAFYDDVTLSANSSTAIPTQHAVKTYVDNLVASSTAGQTLQLVTDAGNTTTNAIQFAGGTSTGDFVLSTGADASLSVAQAPNSTDGHDLILDAGRAGAFSMAGNSGGDVIINGGAGSGFPATPGKVLLATDRGYVGIGSYNANSLLHVQGGDRAPAIVTIDSDDGTSSGNDAGIMINSDYANGSDAGFVEFSNNGTASGKLYSSPIGSGFVVVGNNPFDITVSSTQRFILDGSGNVGFSTSSPAYRLDVVGDARVSAQLMLGRYASLPVSGAQAGALVYNSASSSVHFWDGSQWVVFATGTGAAQAAWIQGGNAFGTAGYLGTNDSQKLYLGTSGTSAMVITETGLVGVGTAVGIPSHNLEVAGNLGFSFMDGFGDSLMEVSGSIGAGTASLRFGDHNGVDTGTAFSISPSSSAFAFMNGNVGIGTSSPFSPLHVEGDIYMASTTPATTTYALYNLGGSLYWDGALLATGTGSGALDLQQVTDNGGITANAIQFAGGTSTGNILPSVTNSISLGSTSNRWSDIWAATLHLGTSTWEIAQAADQALTFTYPGKGEFVQIDKTGRLGIGTQEPEELLSSTGDMLIGQFDSPVQPLSGQNRQLIIRATDASLPGVQGTAYTTYQRDGLDISQIGLDTSDNIAFRHYDGAWNTDMVIDVDGDVSIGTTTAAHRLEVYGGVTAADDLFRVSAGSNGGHLSVYMDSVDDRNSIVEFNRDLAFTSSGFGSNMLHLTNGAVGINTDSPTQALSVVGDAIIGQFDGAVLPIGGTNHSLYINAVDGQLPGTQGTASLVMTRNGGDLARLNVTTANQLLLQNYVGASWVTGLTVAPNGNVGVGDMGGNPDSKLTVYATGSNATIMRLINGNTANFTLEAADNLVTVDFDPKGNANEMAFQAGGGEIMRLRADGVGIGTDRPRARLEIDGDNSAANVDLLKFQAANDSDIQSLLYFQAGRNATYWDVNSSGNGGALILQDSGSEVARFLNGGLVVNAGGTANMDFRAAGDTLTHLLFADASADAVGIGTSTPATLLHIAGTATVRDILPEANVTYDLGSSLRVWEDAYVNTLHVGTSTRWDFFPAGDGGLSIGQTLGSEAVRIDTNGRVGIGTSIPSNALHVVGSARATTGFSANNGTAGSPAFYFTGDTNTGMYESASDAIGLTTGGYLKVNVTTNGNQFIADHFGTDYLTTIDVTSTSANGPFVTQSYKGIWLHPKVSLNSGAQSVRLLDVGDSVITVAGTGITELAGAYLNGSSFTKSGTASITSAYGLYVSAPTIGVNNYAIYSSTGLNKFSDRVSVGPLTENDASLMASANSSTVASFNRYNSDGAVISIKQDSIEEGTISVTGNTVSYNAFTGSHYAWASAAIEKGMLVSLTGVNRRLHDSPNSEIVYGVEKTSQANHDRVMGAYLSVLNPSESQSSDNPSLVMAVGNGEVWVVENGQDVKAGDYLTSSEVVGHAEKDLRATDKSYVVARAAEDVVWGDVDGVVDGRKHKLVSVFFENFVRDNSTGALLQGQQAGEQLAADSIVVVEDHEFRGRVLVKGHVTFGGDSVGQAKILSGQKEVRVIFDEEYAVQPIVTVSPLDFVDTMYRVADVNTKGFLIQLNSTQGNDKLFNWHAFGNDGGKVFVSDGTTSTIQSVTISGFAAPAPLPASVTTTGALVPAVGSGTGEAAASTSADALETAEGPGADASDGAAGTPAPQDPASSGTPTTEQTDLEPEAPTGQGEVSSGSGSTETPEQAPAPEEGTVTP